MSYAVPYAEFNNYNLTWVEDNVADMYGIDYLHIMQASDEEISSAIPSSPPTSFTKAFVATYVSQKLKHIVHKLCNAQCVSEFSRKEILCFVEEIGVQIQVPGWKWFVFFHRFMAVMDVNREDP